MTRESHSEIHNEEHEAPQFTRQVILKSYLPDQQEDPMDIVEPIEAPKPVDMMSRKRYAWLRETLQDEERVGAPKSSFRESKRLQRFSNYMALISNIIDAEPVSFEEATSQ